MIKRVLPAVLFALLVSLLLFAQGESDPLRERRIRMVETQIVDRGVLDPAVLSAMREVRRELFVPERFRHLAYADRPVPIGYGQTISQPYIVAFMTELLDVKPGEQVLEIGTGSGYQAAVLSRLTDRVFTVEIIEELALAAEERFRTHGYDRIRRKTGDGYYGWEGETFDGIIVTAAAGHVPPPLLKQLNIGGRMVIPIGGRFQIQYLTLVIKNRDGTLTVEPVIPVRFVPFTGAPMEGEP